MSKHDPIWAMAKARFPRMPEQRLDEWLEQPGTRTDLQRQVDAYMEQARQQGNERADAEAMGQGRLFL